MQRRTSSLDVVRHYPGRGEIDRWANGVWELGTSTRCRADFLDDGDLFPFPLAARHHRAVNYLRFVPTGMDTFYGVWQPAPSSPAPLLVHTPGYGAEMSVHPELVTEGYNVLHVNPLGYGTPRGPDESRRGADGNWPVLRETVESGAQGGYRIWLANVVMAVRWALRQPSALSGRVSFFGTSQGGAAALLLASVFRGRGVRCVAADLPFLTNFALARGTGNAYPLAYNGIMAMDDPPKGWRAVGFIDTLSHAYRLDLPVMLTAGSADNACPPSTIESLFSRLPSTRMYAYLDGESHCYTHQFLQLTRAWFRLYA